MTTSSAIAPEAPADIQFDRATPVFKAIERWLDGSPGLKAAAVSCYGLRVYRNLAGAWAVLIIELPTPEEFVMQPAVRWKHWNAGQPARPHLDTIATELKRRLLRSIPAHRLAWFYSQPNQVADDRRDPHHPVDRIRFSQVNAVYFGFILEACSREEFERAAGGKVEF